jgi:ABC-type lipoprotein export system ATPase subunit
MELPYDTLIIKKKTIVFGGSIQVDRTGVYLVHGINGSGKTLLLNNIHANSGGRTVLVPQGNTELLPMLTVEENIAMRIIDAPNEEIRELLRRYGLSYLLDLIPGKLSGGENRIISLLRGIFSAAPVVLIDEPTNDLDFTMVKKIVSIISYFAHNKCFLIVTHDSRLESIAKGSMTIINKRVTDDGRVRVINDPGRTPSKLNRQSWACLEAGLLNKIWKKAGNTVGIIVLIMMCILSAYKILTRDDFGDIEENLLPNNQVNLLRAVSNQASSSGLLPLSIIDDIYSGNLWFSAKKINDLLNSTTLTIGKDLPYLPSSVNCTVYPLEYFVDRQYLSVLDIYLSNFIDVDHEMAWVDTRNYFYSEPGIGRRASV